MSTHLPAEAVCEIAIGLLCCSSLLRNSNMATNLLITLQITVVVLLLHVTVERRHLWQVVQ